MQEVINNISLPNEGQGLLGVLLCVQSMEGSTKFYVPGAGLIRYSLIYLQHNVRASMIKLEEMVWLVVIIAIVRGFRCVGIPESVILNVPREDLSSIP